MQTSGVFQTTKKLIEIKKLGEPITMIVFGDVHYGAPLHATDKFNEFCAWAKQLPPSTLFLGMGDYLDFASTSERGLLSRPEIHESTRATIDSMAHTLETEFMHKIDFMKGRLVGMLEGNHEWAHMDGTTTTMRLCQALRTEWLGVSAFIRLNFRYAGAYKPIDVFAHHGKGAARLVGGSLNRVQQMAEAAEADIYLMGHDHKRSVGVASKLYLDHKCSIKERRQLFMRTGSFLKAYQKDTASYIVDLAASPSNLGSVRVMMTPHRPTAQGKKSFVVDLEAAV